MIKIIFKDMYDSTASVLIRFAETPGKMFETIRDFTEICGDVLSDESAVLVARRFYVYAKRIGYPVVLDSPEMAPTNFKVDLASGNITPSRELGDEIHLPTALSEIKEAMPGAIAKLPEGLSPEEIAKLPEGNGMDFRDTMEESAEIPTEERMLEEMEAAMRESGSDDNIERGQEMLRHI